MFEQQVNLGPGTGTFTQHTFEILTMLLVAFLLGVWLGWMLWNRYKQEADKLHLEVQSLTASVGAFNTEITSLKSKLATAEAGNLSLRAQVDKLTEENRIFRDQLSETTEDLAETEQRNRQLETELGLSFAAYSPTPESIPLEINVVADAPAETPPPAPAEEPAVTVIVETPAAPVEVTVQTTETPAEVVVETPAAEVKVDVVTPVAEEKPPAFVATATVSEGKDDLIVIEGIGPKIQELLYQYGILSYRQLAETDVAHLKEILAEAGPQLAMHDPGTWPSQANLAANGQWEALKSIQGFLKGGKKPT